MIRLMRNNGAQSTQRGFTLLEVLLAAGISTLLVGTVSITLALVLQSRAKNATVAEVEQQGLAVMQRISHIVRNAQGITAPLQGVSASTLVLDVVDSVNDPTTFTDASGAVTMTAGVGAPIELTSDRITVSNLSFLNASRTDTPGTVRIQFTLTHVNPEGRNEYEYTQEFLGSASLRENE